MVVRSFVASDHDAVCALWARVFVDEPDWNESAATISRKLRVQPDLFLVADDDGVVVGTTIAGYDGVRGWVHKVCSDPERRGAGIARALMSEAEQRLRALGCIKLNLQVRDGNDNALEFYRAAGYVVEERVSMGKLLGGG